MESHFNHDFRHVRVHSDERAAQTASALHADAFTARNDIVFAAGKFAPRAHSGRFLLAHELAHVVQQRNAPGGTPEQLSASSPAESEADAAAHRVVDGRSPQPITHRAGSLQARIAVERPTDNIPNPTGTGAVQTNARAVQGYLTTICAAGGVAVDATTGQMNMNTAFCTPAALPAGVAGPPATAAQTSGTPAGCTCLCDLAASANAWRIRVDDADWPHTVFDDDAKALGRTPGGTGGIVTTPSPNSPKLWGAATRSGNALNIDPWLVLGHELCGHAWLGNSGSAAPDERSPRGEGGHQTTVDRENALRAEHGIDLRGTYKDPNCGESFWRSRTNPATVNWSSYRGVCERWRARYNASHGTTYRITDTIP